MTRKHVIRIALSIAFLLTAAAQASGESGDLSYRPYRDRADGSEWRGGSMEGRTMLRVHAGISAPTGDFDNAANTGVGLGASLGYGISHDVVLAWGVAYHRFDEEVVDGHVSVTPVTMNVDYGFSTRSKVRPWVSGGLGLYHVSEGLKEFDPAIGFFTDTFSENDFGLNFGFGIATPISPRTSFGAGFMFHHIVGNDFPDTDFAALQAGLGFSL
jgi:opacity protein-like surface antigen